MVTIRINEQNYVYDIYTLVKAFFPGEEVAWEKEVQTGIIACDVLIVEIIFKEKVIEQLLWQQKQGMAASETVCAAKLAFRPDEDYKTCKNELKRALYTLLSGYTGRVLPWGTLTGIRPVKLVSALQEQGLGKEGIMQHMKEEYLLSQKKADISQEIADNEQQILKHIMLQDTYSLYVGIPFCPTRCLYCSFPSYSLKELQENIADLYVDALVQELSYVADMMIQKSLTTIYIGGGTPTTLTPTQSERLLTEIERLFDVSKLKEYTVEAGRPDSITKEKLMVYQAHGITRISINPQTMHQKTLDVIGRRHTVLQTEEAFFMARDCGFENINMDIIVGLPGETKEEIEETLRRVCALKPDSLTVHSLAVKRGSRLFEINEKYTGFDIERADEIMDMVEDYARGCGLAPYYLYRQKNMSGNMENVGYAALDKAGIYNILIMEEKQTIMAVGAGAITKLVFPNNLIKRVENVKNLEQYIDRVKEMAMRKHEGLKQQEREI